MAPPVVRRTIRDSVHQSLERRGGHRADQGAAWDAVAGELRRHGAVSATGAAMDAQEAVWRDRPSLRSAAEELEARGPPPRQCGVAITHGLRVQAVEVFGSARLLRAHWRGIVRANLMDAGTRTESPSPERALWAVRRILWMRSQATPGLGLGTETRARDEVLTAVALTVGRGLVHYSALFAR